MLEWSNRPVLKTGVLHGTVGSNPTPSATDLALSRRTTNTSPRPCGTSHATGADKEYARDLISLRLPVTGVVACGVRSPRASFRRVTCPSHSSFRNTHRLSHDTLLHRTRDTLIAIRSFTVLHVYSQIPHPTQRASSTRISIEEKSITMARVGHCATHALQP